MIYKEEKLWPNLTSLWDCILVSFPLTHTENLKPNGIYVFDIFNLQALTDEVINTFVMDIKREVDGIQFRNHQTSELDRENGLLISHDHYLIDDGSHQEEHTNTFALQIYTPDELKVLLERNGFEIIEQYDMDGQEFIPEKSLNILTISRKIS